MRPETWKIIEAMVVSADKLRTIGMIDEHEHITILDWYHNARTEEFNRQYYEAKWEDKHHE